MTGGFLRAREIVATFLAVALLAAVASSCTPPAEKEETGAKPKTERLLILAAADLKNAFEEIGQDFEEEAGVKTVFSFGSTGQLAQQIEQGGRADIFAAANVSYVEGLKDKDLTFPETQELYAVGRIVVYSGSDAREHPKTLKDLTDPAIKRIAIANPDHAPYGVAAKEALLAEGLWKKVEKKLVLGENAAQTLQYVKSGNVDAGIIPLSLAVGAKGEYDLVPSRLHKPLLQAMTVLRSTKDEKAAREFVEFVNGPKGRPIMKKYGFVLPDEAATEDSGERP